MTSSKTKRAIKQWEKNKALWVEGKMSIMHNYKRVLINVRDIYVLTSFEEAFGPKPIAT